MQKKRQLTPQKVTGQRNSTTTNYPPLPLAILKEKRRDKLRGCYKTNAAPTRSPNRTALNPNTTHLHLRRTHREKQANQPTASIPKNNTGRPLQPQSLNHTNHRTKKPPSVSTSNQRTNRCYPLQRTRKKTHNNAHNGTLEDMRREKMMMYRLAVDACAAPTDDLYLRNEGGYGRMMDIENLDSIQVNAKQVQKARLERRATSKMSRRMFQRPAKSIATQLVD